MLSSLATSPWRARTVVLLAVSAALGLAAAAVGVDDNPPGLVLGLSSAVAFVVAFVHPWGESRQFRRLIYACLAGALVFAVVSNLIEVVSARTSVPASLDAVLNAVAVAVMLLIPAGLLVGVVGALLRSRNVSGPQGGTPAD